MCALTTREEKAGDSLATRLHHSLPNTWSGRPGSQGSLCSQGLAQGRAQRESISGWGRTASPAWTPSARTTCFLPEEPQTGEAGADLEVLGMTGLGLSALTLPENREPGQNRFSESHPGLGLGSHCWHQTPPPPGPSPQEGEIHSSRASPKLHSLISSKNAASSSALGLNKHPCLHTLYILVEGMTWKRGRWWWCSKTGLCNKRGTQELGRESRRQGRLLPGPTAGAGWLTAGGRFQERPQVGTGPVGVAGAQGAQRRSRSLTGPWRRGGDFDLRVVAVACQAPLSMEFSRQEYWGG